MAPRGSEKASMAAVLVLTALAAMSGQSAAQGGSFTPSTGSCTAGTCPSVKWSDVYLDTPGNFILTSSPRAGSNNYISFAFGTSQNMEDAIMVVDCYEPNGTMTIGTSINSLDNNGTLDNNDNAVVLSSLSNTVATKSNGVLSCSFTMDFPDSSDVYIMLAEGILSTEQFSPPKKQQHFAVYVSPTTLQDGSVGVTGPMLSRATAFSKVFALLMAGLLVAVASASVVH